MRNKMTLEDHKTLGANLVVLRKSIMDCWLTVPTKKEGRKLRAMQESVDRIRSSMEDRLFKEYPEDASIYIYYPGKLIIEGNASLRRSLL